MTHIVQVVSGPHEGKAFLIKDGEEVVLGRHETNQVVIAFDGYISTRHATLSLNNGLFEIMDLKSSNGSYLDGARIPPDKWHSVKDFFVLGSTIFKVEPISHPEVSTYSDPEPLASHDWQDHPIFNRAVQLSQDYHTDLINSPLIFLALLERCRDEVVPFLKSIDINPKDILKKFTLGNIFEGPNVWLNNILKIQAVSYDLKELHISPIVKKLMDTASDCSPFDPFEFLEPLLLKNEFSLIYPLLKWETTRPKWTTYFKESRSSPEKRTAPSLDRPWSPKEFWANLENVLGDGNVLQIQGFKGCGKSAIMTRIFAHDLPPVMKSLDGMKRTLFDPKTFLYFAPKKKLNSYVASIVAAMGQPGVVGIDHFDYLLTLMEQNGINKDELIQTAHLPSALLILASDSASALITSQMILGMETINVEGYPASLLFPSMEKLFTAFTANTSYELSMQTKSFLTQEFTRDSKVDIKELRSFLNLCATRLAEVPPEVLESLDCTSPDLTVSQYFFEEVLAEFRLEHGGPINQEETPPPLEEGNEEMDSAELREFILQIELLIQTYVREEFKMRLSYSDKTQSISESRILSEAEKMDELKAYMILLLSAYRESFQKWFKNFWFNLEPDNIRITTKQGTTPKKLWMEYLSRTKNIDLSLAEDEFSEATAEVFKDAWRNQTMKK